MTEGVWHLPVNQPEDSDLAKAAKASEVYRLIAAISTAAPNKPKRCSKKEAANRAFTGRKSRQKPPTSTFHLLNQRRWSWQRRETTIPAEHQQHVELQKPLISSFLSEVFFSEAIQEEIWDLFNFLIRVGRAAVCSERANTAEPWTQLRMIQILRDRRISLHLSWTRLNFLQLNNRESKKKTTFLKKKCLEPSFTQNARQRAVLLLCRSKLALKHRRADRVALPSEHFRALCLKKMRPESNLKSWDRWGKKNNNNKNEKKEREIKAAEMWSVSELTTSGIEEGTSRRAKWWSQPFRDVGRKTTN